MPSRLGIVAIVLFWLVSTSWLIVREIAPRFRTGEPPAFFTDEIDEVGGTTILWTILHNGKRVGGGDSSVERRPDRTFVLSSNLRLEKFDILFINIKRITSRYRVDRDGNLKELATDVRMTLVGGDMKVEVKGVVRGGLLVPRIFVDNNEATNLGPLQPQPVKVAAHGNILNTMHLLNKIPGLRVGQSWEVPLLDPLGALPGQKMASSTLLAEVGAAELVWQGQIVPCFRIDYWEPGKKPAAHTWVRRSDGLVLQQQAHHDERDLVLVREVTR